jgi:hypothetical protein
VKFIGIQISNHSQRKKILTYFKKLQKRDPIVKEFSDPSVPNYVSFPSVDSENPSVNCWVLEVFVAEERFYFSYRFQLPKSFIPTKCKLFLPFVGIKLIQRLVN